MPPSPRTAKMDVLCEAAAELARDAARAKAVTVNEVVLLPGEGALLSSSWLPWTDRIQPGDVTPGVLMPSPEEDPRLEPGYTGGEQAGDPDPAEESMVHTVVAELGLGRERVLSFVGRQDAIERWLAGPGGPDNEMARLAPDVCETCGFFVRLQASMGVLFGACTNAYSPSDGSVVSIDHGCGAHSSIAAHKQDELPSPVWETIQWDEPTTL